MSRTAPRLHGRPCRALRALWFGLILFCVHGAHAATVEIVLGEDTAAYAEAARAIAEDLSGRAAVSTVPADAIVRGAKRAQVNLVITLGLRALQADLGSDRIAPTVATLLPRQAYERAAASAPRALASRTLTAVFLDQPPARQLNLIRLLTPERTRIGIIASAALDESVRGLESAARDQRLVIRRETLAQAADLHAALLRLMPDTDAMLALPDPLVFNSLTIHNILLTTYRAKQPLFGFSPSYTQSGAIAAVYSTPRQIARQVADLAIRFLADAPLPPPQYPRTFSVSINATVANSLNIAVDSEQNLTNRLQSLEREP
jgi:putative ABC transport system substrate-binding protein